MLNLTQGAGESHIKNLTVGAETYPPDKYSGDRNEADYGTEKSFGGRNRSALSEGGKGTEKCHPQ